MSMSSDLGFLEGLDPGLTGDHTTCTDCFTRDRRRVYCDAHRCHGLNARGERCRQPADPGRAYTYCRTHGCAYRYPTPPWVHITVLCTEHHAPGNHIYCDEHGPIVAFNKAQDQKRDEYEHAHYRRDISTEEWHEVCNEGRRLYPKWEEQKKV